MCLDVHLAITDMLEIKREVGFLSKGYTVETVRENYMERAVRVIL